MITIKSNGYWSTGITVNWSPRAQYRNGEHSPGWAASLDFFDDGFCDDDADAGQVATQGKLQTRYLVVDGALRSGLEVALDVLLADAQRMGITFQRPYLYYRGDGEDEDYPPPDGWKEALAVHAERLGWETPYKMLDAIKARRKETR